MDRLTFQLEQDASGEVDVHVHKTQVHTFLDDLIFMNEVFGFAHKTLGCFHIQK